MYPEGGLSGWVIPSFFSFGLERKVRRGGYPTLVYPPCLTGCHTIPALPEVIYARIKARVRPVVHTVRTVAPRVHRWVDGFTLLLGTSTRVGFSRTKGRLFTLRINPEMGGNLSIKAKKPATESRCAQGRREYPDPSATVMKPPSRSWPAFSVPFRGVKASLFYRDF